MSYDSWKCNPPDLDEPAHCTCCEENQQRVVDLEECLTWVGEHLGRITELARKDGLYRVMLLPNDGRNVSEGKSLSEALEKLWHEHE